MCQFEPAPLPGFQAPQTAIDGLVGVLFLLVIFFAALKFATHPQSLGCRWFGKGGAIIVSLLPALCVTFAACMMWLFLIPSSEAIKHWDAIQRTMIAQPCTPEDLDAAYFSASDRIDPYYNLLFGLPALCGVLGLIVLGWRWPIQLRIKSHE
jgi:hypothetical protein